LSERAAGLTAAEGRVSAVDDKPSRAWPPSDIVDTAVAALLEEAGELCLSTRPAPARTPGSRR